eukprot:g50107.t1
MCTRRHASSTTGSTCSRCSCRRCGHDVHSAARDGCSLLGWVLQEWRELSSGLCTHCFVFSCRYTGIGRGRWRCALLLLVLWAARRGYGALAPVHQLTAALHQHCQRTAQRKYMYHLIFCERLRALLDDFDSFCARALVYDAAGDEVQLDTDFVRAWLGASGSGGRRPRRLVRPGTARGRPGAGPD